MKIAKKTSMTTFIITLVLLWIGGIAAGLLLGYIPLNINNAWVAAFLMALVQAVILSLAGVLTGKMSLMPLIIAAVLIFMGGLLGGFICSYVDLSGLYATIVVLVVQTGLLSLTGHVGGGKFRL